jgi:hypothetical protein
MVPAGEAVSRSAAAFANASAAGDRSTTARPGFVQNWPEPRVTLAARPFAMASPRAARARGRMKTGFDDPISA